MGRDGDGVEVRPTSIRLFFIWQSVRYRETLTVNGTPMKPTAPNILHARRTMKELKKAIALGTFALADYFPDSPRAGAKSTDRETFGKMADLWLAGKGRLATKTKDQYRNALEVWKSLLGAQKPIASMTHGYVAAKVGGHPWASAKLLNNYLIPLRGVFTLAGRELKLKDNPLDGIENSKHQAPPPDPLTGEERDKVLADMRKHYDERIVAYFVFAFATGMRPEEEIGLRWSDVDWVHKTVLVQRAVTAGEEKPIKTYQVRDVDLTADALAALQVMKAHTFMLGVEERIFMNPVTGKAWHDERSQRDHYWTPTLRRLGIRHRRAYQTRHTFATTALMGDVNPTYISRQMGHRSAKMLFSVYAKWIDGADKGRERAKMEAAQTGAPGKPKPAEKAGG